MEIPNELIKRARRIAEKEFESKIAKEATSVDVKSTKFNLSNLIVESQGQRSLTDIAVKEFIKRRDALDRLYMLGQITMQEHADKCEKLAGDKLNG